MKKCKKLLSLVLVFTMMMAMTLTAFAATVDCGSEDDGSIEISNAKSGETYTIYKIFDVTVTTSYDEDEEIVYNYAYTTSSAVKTLIESLVEEDGTCPFTFTTNDGELYYVTLTDECDVYDIISLLAKYIELDGVTAYEKGTADDDGLTFSNVDLGYYYITTTTGSVVTINSVGTEVELKDKNEEPGVEKTSSDSGEEESYGKSTSVSVGDTVYFEVTITVGDGAENYVFHDTMSEGLTFSGTDCIVVTLNGEAVTSDCIVASNCSDGCTFEVDLSGLTLSDGDKIIITYSAVVNSEAVENDEDTNEAYVSYGDASSTEKSTTTNTVYSFDLVKTDSSGIPLNGAEFTLTDSDGDTIYFLYYSGTKTYVVCAEKTNDAVSTITVTDGEVIVDGLATGTYTLTEIKAPDGYNLLKESVTIEISVDEDGNEIIEVDDEESDNVTIENTTGSELPSTGGMGTTVLYAIGIILILGAGVVLVSKRRMRG